jgi:hypothetical protein
MTNPTAMSGPAADIAAKVPPPSVAQIEGVQVAAPLDEQTEKKLDDIEMIGEEEAAGYHRPGTSEVSAGMRYLHSSRTIHQLVTDRNRAVGIYLAVASLLWTASSAILNAKPENLKHLIVPITAIQRWCLPVTFGTMTVLAVFVGFLLIRTRIGLIYEVAKMNVLLGLPAGRVKRINPLSIFFIMHTLVSVFGGASAALFALHMAQYAGLDGATTVLCEIITGVVVCVALVVLYIGTVLYTTSDKRLGGA